MALPFIPRKRFGQHFLVDPNLAAKIVGTLAAPPDAPVVEIGPGTGALTKFLLQRYKDFTAVEVDERAVAYLEAAYESLCVSHGDILALDWAALSTAKGGRLHVIGNLPYNITSPILFALLRHRQALSQAVLMMQREVAQRIVAKPKTKQYGIPSVLAQLYASVKLLFRVPQSVFVPKPAVESAIIRLRFDKAEVHNIDHELLRSIVRAAFGQRRKVLRNSLYYWTRGKGIALPDDWGCLRAEDIAPEGFVALARHIQAALPGRSATLS